MRVQRKNILMTMALALVFVLAVGPVAGAEMRGDALAAMSDLGAQLAWVPNGTAEYLALSVSGPDTDYAQRFDSGDSAVFSLYDEEGNARPDGSYTWELREEAGPVNDHVRDAANGRDTTEHEGARRVEFSGRLQWGSFTLLSGAVVDSGVAEVPATRPAKN